MVSIIVLACAITGWYIGDRVIRTIGALWPFRFRTY
jgi:hypothetical protein